MVNVKLGNEMKKIKKSESRTGFEPITFRTPIGCFSDSRETRGELRHILGSCMTCVLRTARNSNVRDWW